MLVTIKSVLFYTLILKVKLEIALGMTEDFVGTVPYAVIVMFEEFYA